jgi:hypothetical protein
VTWAARRKRPEHRLERKRYRDPLTGDLVGRSERVSLFVQAIMRRWIFVFAYTTVTVLWWTHPQWFGDQPGKDARWQDWASYMALLIESVVGIGMFSWARRDSQVIRKIHALERKAEQQEENAHVVLHEIYRLTTLELEQLRLLLEIKRNGNGNGHTVADPVSRSNGGGSDRLDHQPDLGSQDPRGGQDS